MTKELVAMAETLLCACVAPALTRTEVRAKAARIEKLTTRLDMEAQGMREAEKDGPFWLVNGTGKAVRCLESTAYPPRHRYGFDWLVIAAGSEDEAECVDFFSIDLMEQYPAIQRRIEDYRSGVIISPYDAAVSSGG
jgi:hypothetical protein